MSVEKEHSDTEEYSSSSSDSSDEDWELSDSSDNGREVEAMSKNELENGTDEPPLLSLPTPGPGALNILIKNPPSRLTQQNLDWLRMKHNIPDDIEMRLPQGEERADWSIQGWSTVYFQPFEYGFKLPISGLLKSFCEYVMVNPSQLTPNTLRIIFSIEKLTRMCDLKWDPVDFFPYYVFMGQERGRFQLSTGHSNTRIILGLSREKTTWKDTYFFVRGNWISQGSDQIPYSWNPTSPRLGNKHGNSVHNLRVERLMLIDPNLRDWVKLLMYPCKDQAHDQDEELSVGKSYSEETNTRKALLRIMANANVNTNAANSNKNMVETSNGSSHVVTSVPEPEMEPPHNKRPRSESPPAEAAQNGEVISISVPVSGSLATNPTPMLAEARKLLVPEDEKIMQTMMYKDLAEEELKLALKLFQHQVYREREFEKQLNHLSNCMNTIKELGSSNAVLGSRLEASEKAASASNKKVKELEAEVNQLKKKEQTLVAQVERMKLELANKEKLMKELSDDACLRVTGRLMRKFLQGKITESFACRSVADWETYLGFLGESISNADSESEEEEVKPKVC